MIRYSDPVASRSESVLLTIVLGSGAILLFVANLFGLWWVTTVFGVVVGLLPWRGRRIFGTAALVGVLGWGLGLLWLAFQEPVGDAASVVAGIMGFGSIGAITIVLTLILAAILGMIGAWLGLAVRRLIEPRFRDPFGQL